MSNTSNLVLPYLAVGQAQKHVTVNESLRKLDAIVQLSAVSATVASQPGGPADGAVYILPAGKTGADWSAFADASLAYYRDGAWVELSPREGWIAYVKDAGLLLHYTGSAWSLFPPAALLAVSASDRVLGRVSSGSGPAEELAFTDPARQLCDDASFEAMCATLGTWKVLAASAVAVPLTGSTSETALATVAIPGGLMGANGILRVTIVGTWTNDADDKTWRIRLGGLSGTAYLAVVATTSASLSLQRHIWNRGAADSQMAWQVNNGNSYVANGGGVVTGSVDTASAQDLVISGQLEDASDTMTLQAWIVEVLSRA